MKRMKAIGARLDKGIWKQPARRPGITLETFSGQVIASANDAQELISTGAVTIDANILPMGGYASVNDAYTIGIRFTGVTIGQGESVPYAALRFVASNQNTKGCLLRVWCEDADNAAEFTTTGSSITARTKTTASVDWDVGPWEAGQDNAATINELLDPVVQEVVNRAGWVSGNALVFLIETSPAIVDTENPRRRAWSYDGSSADAPRLSVNTTEGSTTPGPSPTGDFSDGYDLFGLEGRNSGTGSGEFNPASPTLKDGTSITGQPLTDYHTIIRHMNTQSSGDSLVNFDSRMAAKNSYAAARYAGTVQHAWTRAFRLTGDLRFLDALCRGYERQRTEAMIIRFDEISGWNPDKTRGGKCSYPSEPYPWSPYQKVPWTYALSEWYGTDCNYTDAVKMMARTGEFVWMLWLNRNKTSPLAYNYQTLFNTWKTIMEESYVYTWSGNGYGTSADPTECWADNIRYWGDRSTPTTKRATWGAHPILCGNGAHTAVEGWPVSRYVGLLGLHAGADVGSPQVAYDAALTLATAIVDNPKQPWRDNPSNIGTGLVFRRADWYHEGSSPTASSLTGTYLGHTANILVDAWMTGYYRAALPYSLMRRLARNLHDMVNTDGSTKGDMLEGAPSNETGWGPSGVAGRSAHSTVVFAITGHSVFEDDSVSTKIESMMRVAQETSFGGGWSTDGVSGSPKAPIVPSLLFTKWALNEVGDTADD